MSLKCIEIAHAVQYATYYIMLLGLITSEGILGSALYHRCSYTAKNAQVSARLHLAVIKSISGCVRIACSDLMITSLLWLSTGLMQVDCQDFLSTRLMQTVSTTRSKSANINLQQV